MKPRAQVHLNKAVAFEAAAKRLPEKAEPLLAAAQAHQFAAKVVEHGVENLAKSPIPPQPGPTEVGEPVAASREKLGAADK